MKRLVAPTLLLAALAAVLPSPAVAGGNWISFRSGEESALEEQSRRDVFASGEVVFASVRYLSGSLDPDDGPFHLWVEQGDDVVAGHPIPASAIDLGSFVIAADGRSAHLAFVLPELPSGEQSLVICDDPCETWGLGEWVQGWLTAAPTVGEARLLARLRELRWTAWERRHELSSELRAAERDEDRLRRRLRDVEADLEAAREQLARLTAERPEAPRSEAVIDGTAGAFIAASMIAVAAVILARRRRERIVIPDTPAELLGQRSDGRSSERILEDLNV